MQPLASFLWNYLKSRRMTEDCFEEPMLLERSGCWKFWILEKYQRCNPLASFHPKYLKFRRMSEYCIEGVCELEQPISKRKRSPKFSDRTRQKFKLELYHIKCQWGWKEHVSTLFSMFLWSIIIFLMLLEGCMHVSWHSAVIFWF